MNIGHFIHPAILPTSNVRMATLDGENTDPANGLTPDDGLRAYCFWSEMAYCPGRACRIRAGSPFDERQTAPGADTIRELFGAEPTLILLHEVSVSVARWDMSNPRVETIRWVYSRSLQGRWLQPSGGIGLDPRGRQEGREASDAYKTEKNVPPQPWLRPRALPSAQARPPKRTKRLTCGRPQAGGSGASRPGCI